MYSDDRVLLCKRGIEPRINLWTFPSGFLELNEATIDGAIRETREETCAQVDVEDLYAVFDLPYMSQVYMFYRSKLCGSYAIGAETNDVRLFAEAEIPWDELAFPVINITLKHYFDEMVRGNFHLHTHVFRTRAEAVAYARSYSKVPS